MLIGESAIDKRIIIPKSCGGPYSLGLMNQNVQPLRPSSLETVMHDLYQKQ